jgi:hypothetical protein
MQKRKVRLIERRTGSREPCKVPVTVREVNDSFTYRARIANYSGKGMYIETDYVLEPGAHVLINIEDFVEITLPESVDDSGCLLSEIIWQEDSPDNIFSFGYGAKLIPPDDNQPSLAATAPVRPELRRHPRKSCPKPVFFTSQQRYCRGFIQNISRNGVFIKTTQKITAGRIIKLVIPGTEIDKGIMLKGQVVHFSQAGIGIVFKSILKRRVKIINPQLSPTQSRY